MLHASIDALLRHDIFQYIASSDPGAVGAGKNWLDTTTASAPVWNRRNDANDGWIVMASGGGGGGGGTLSAGVFSSRPAPGNAGAGYISTDTPMLISVDNGASWDDYVMGIPVVLPDPGDFTFFNQGAATFGAQGGYVRLTGTQQNGERGSFVVTPMPGTTFTLIAKFFAPYAQSASNWAGIGLRDSTGGPFFSDIIAALKVTSASGEVLYITQQASTTDGQGAFGGAVSASGQFASLGSLYCVKLVGNGTDITFYWSQDGGITFYSMGSVSYVVLIALGWNGNPDRIGPFVYTGGSGSTTPFPIPYIDLVSWDLS